jgi:hypothetical protein
MVGYFTAGTAGQRSALLRGQRIPEDDAIEIRRARRRRRLAAGRRTAFSAG